MEDNMNQSGMGPNQGQPMGSQQPPMSQASSHLGKRVSLQLWKFILIGAAAVIVAFCLGFCGGRAMGMRRMMRTRMPFMTQQMSPNGGNFNGGGQNWGQYQGPNGNGGYYKGSGGGSNGNQQTNPKTNGGSKK